MFWIEKIDEKRYRITDGSEELVFNKAKFEDLYYAVPTHPTQFYRLLVEELVDSDEERALMNRIIERAGDREYNIDILQEEIRKLPEP